MKRQVYILGTLFLMLLAWGGCKKGDGKTDAEQMPPMVDNTPKITGDKMLYGLCCDGTGDSSVVIWPFKGDPITYSCIDAKDNHKIIGKPEIGDWIGVLVDPEDKTQATMVVDLDALKGTWTYPVMPTMKELQNMSRRAQRRIMAQLDDSIKKDFLIPREYGFTLKRSHVASPVGRVMRSNSLEDDSPVTYPKVKNYQKWYMLNGKIILISGDMMMAAPAPGQKAPKPQFVIDTLDFVSMTADSLVLMDHNTRYGFHRKANAMEANKKAQQKEAKRK